MNHISYKYLIEPWIPMVQRPILEKRHMWLMAIKRLYHSKKYHILLADICIHNGVCNKRYCICKYFSEIDKTDCFDRIFRTYIRILFKNKSNTTQTDNIN